MNYRLRTDFTVVLCSLNVKPNWDGCGIIDRAKRSSNSFSLAAINKTGCDLCYKRLVHDIYNEFKIIGRHKTMESL